MAVFLVRLAPRAGTAGAHYVSADEHSVAASGTHRLYSEGRLVWQGRGDDVVDVRRFEERQEAVSWHKAHRHELMAHEIAQRHEAHGSTNKSPSPSPFIGGVSVRIKGAD